LSISQGANCVPLRLIGDGPLIKPSRSSNAPTKLIELGLGYVQGEGADRGTVRRTGALE